MKGKVTLLLDDDDGDAKFIPDHTNFATVVVEE